MAVNLFYILSLYPFFSNSSHFNLISGLVLQKNVQDLQSAVDLLQKEKEELVLALQSAKKDTNQAKYEGHCLAVPVAAFMP